MLNKNIHSFKRKEKEKNRLIKLAAFGSCMDHKTNESRGDDAQLISPFLRVTGTPMGKHATHIT